MSTARRPMWRKWWIWFMAVGLAILIGLALVAAILSRRLEPFVREQTVKYLQERFDAEVKIGRLNASMPAGSPLRMLLAGGKGVVVRVAARDVAVRLRGADDSPPLLGMRRLEFTIDLSTLWKRPVDVHLVQIERLQLNIPPKRERPAIPRSASGAGAPGAGVYIREVIADGSTLTIQPKTRDKAPLVFEMHELRMSGAGPGRAMQYQAKLTNAKPPGTIASTGTFGPWNSSDPSSTPLDGRYTFNDADLGVFKGISGKLSSEGEFHGVLQRLEVDGVTETPDFGLDISDNRIPLTTRFHALVDATNGNTLLQPVEAQLGETRFECRGGLARNRDDIGRTLDMAVELRTGVVEDLLRLAMKGPKPILRGGIRLKMKLELPPGRAEIMDRLKVHGSFSIRNARFTSSTVQEKIDTLSRRGQGRPKDFAIEEVPSNLSGDFVLQLGKITFSRLQFTVPGSAVHLAGQYLFEHEELDFRGKLRLQARVSETMTGWKRWLLKPVDPFFAKDGAGTVLSIAVTGPRANPSFGRDRR